MKKDDAEKYIKRFLIDWRRETGQLAVPSQELRFPNFWIWLQENHPQVLDFRTTRTVRDDVELWFDQAFGQTWMR